MFTDASEEYYRGFIATCLIYIIRCAKFNQNEKQTSLSYRKFIAAKYALSNFG